jgi:hypothetical protein
LVTLELFATSPGAVLKHLENDKSADGVNQSIEGPIVHIAPLAQIIKKIGTLENRHGGM